jgi:hypothetical protein
MKRPPKKLHFLFSIEIQGEEKKKITHRVSSSSLPLL